MMPALLSISLSLPCSCVSFSVIRDVLLASDLDLPHSLVVVPSVASSCMWVALCCSGDVCRVLLLTLCSFFFCVCD